jgi:hypothetical protein
MGSNVIGNCECGFISNSPVGGGMLDFEMVCYFPALCHVCHDCVTINLFLKKPKCPKCKNTSVIPYDDPELIGTTIDSVAASWYAKDKLGRDLILYEGTYLCPACGNYSLYLEDCGLSWD